MKIIHILNSSGFSGAENVVCQIVDMFRSDKDIEMVYCCPDGAIKKTLAERKIRFVPLKKLSVSEIKRVIKDEKPDLIHAHDMRASFISACACGSIPLISHIHNNAFDSRGISIKSLAYWFAAKKARHIFWVSNSSYEGYRFHAQFNDKSSVLYNVINVDALYEKMASDEHSYDFDIVYLGRLTYPKDPERLIQICKIVVDKKPDIKIAIVGTGELETETKQLAANLRLNDNVKFLGYQSNPLKILHDSKVMVMTSRWEGTPMCALEAMALGVPIVSTPVDGLKDLVINGGTGLLSDDNFKIADELIRISTQPRQHDLLSDKSKIISNRINNLNSYRSAIMKGYGKQD